MARHTSGNAVQLARQIRDLENALREVEANHVDAVLRELAALAQLGDRGTQRRQLDKTILEELRDLLEKLSLLKSANPPPGFIPSILQEIILLLTKLVFKAWILQNMQLPRINPRLAGGSLRGSRNRKA